MGFAVRVRVALGKIVREFIPNVPKLCMSMACNQLKDSPFPPEMIQKVRDAWFGALDAEGGDEETLTRFRTRTPNQPFFSLHWQGVWS